jgi:hypothetical protein
MPIREAGDMLMKYNYAETKDLCKEFLTLVTGILVFSLTFSEKIVDFRRSRNSAKVLLLSSWTLLVASIVSCGIALTYLALAGGQAVYGEGDYYLELANKSYGCVIGSGLFFITGLTTLVSAGMIGTFTHDPGTDSLPPATDQDE